MKNMILIMMLIANFVAVAPSYAQEDTEIGRLKERLMALEQKIYSNPGQKEASSGTLMADFQVRLSNMEEESQKIYGAVEELGYTVNEFAKKMDLIAKDFDLRLRDLEESLVDMPKKVNDASTSKNNKTSKQNEKLKNAPSSVKPVKKEVSTSSVPDNLKAEDLYAKAYHFLVATSYNDSETWMKEFIKRFPSHDLADNAHYWLGEIYLVKEVPEKAVVSFSTGLAKFPKGAKAPANLLKMGTAFKQMDKKDFAESSWNKLLKDFKDSPEAVKAQAELDSLKAEG